MDIKEGVVFMFLVKCFVRVCNIVNDLLLFRGVIVNNYVCLVMKLLFSVLIGWELLVLELMIVLY